MSEKIKCEKCGKVWELPNNMTAKEEDHFWARVYQHYHKHRVEQGLVKKRQSKYYHPVNEPNEIKDSANGDEQ